MATVLPKFIAALPLSHHHYPPPLSRRRLHLPSNRRLISAAAVAAGGEIYRPFRPPPSPLPSKYRSLDPAERIEILRDRLGLWHEYAPLISSLAGDGFTPPSIEESTGISSVEQNQLLVAVQVRGSLLDASPELLAYFDSTGGADVLYELRLLNTVQRAAAARHVVQHRLDTKSAQELARAVKDFPRRRGDEGWDRFSAAEPGDCLAYTHFRLSREAVSPADRAAALERAMEAVATETARAAILEEMDRISSSSEDNLKESLRKRAVPVVRLRYGEVADATTVVVLPVFLAAAGSEGSISEVPRWCEGEGDLGVVAAEKGWARWVVLPRWDPVAGLREGVAVEFRDARAIPWRSNRWRKEEAVLVVADRGRREVAEEESFYLVDGGGLGLGLAVGVERGKKLLEDGVKEVFGTVVLVVRPPKEEEDDAHLNDDDWE